MQTNKIEKFARQESEYYQHGLSVEGDLLGLLLLLLGDLGPDLRGGAAGAHRGGGQGHVTERRRVLRNKTTNERRGNRVLTNRSRVIRVLTNERRALRVLTNKRRVLPGSSQGRDHKQLSDDTPHCPVTSTLLKIASYTQFLISRNQ